MSDREVEPWPAWVRYPLIAALVVIGVGGLVLAVVNGVDGVVVRVVVAAVVVPALLLPVQLIGLRRRSQRLTGRLDEQLDDVAARIRDEQARPAPERPTGASDTDLAGAASWVDATRRQVAAGDPGAAASIEQLQRSTQGWAQDAPLSLAVERCARSARTLGKVSRRADRTGLNRSS